MARRKLVISKVKMVDTRKKTLLKAICWRILGFISLGIITWMVTKSFEITSIVSIFYSVVQILMYFLHERIWNYIRWGKTKGAFIQMTGLSGSGKTAISKIVAKLLQQRGYLVEIIDGDEYRQNISKDLGFSKEDRFENIRRLGFIARILSRNNVIAILAAINPYEEMRQELSKLGAKTVFVNCSLEKLIERDPKGLYHRALLEDDHPDKLCNFTGISDTFEEPKNPDLILYTDYPEEMKEIGISVETNKLLQFILSQL